jgi:hypothetical protein
MNQIFFIVIPKYLNFATFSKNPLAIFYIMICPAFWWQDISMLVHLVCSVITSRPTSLLPSVEASMFLSVIYVVVFMLS